MSSIILRTSARHLLVLLVLASVFVLLRGHDEPGGGFIGGLLAAGGLALYGLAFGGEGVRKALRVDPRAAIGTGLVLALAAAFAGPLAGEPVLTVLWASAPVPGLGKVSTALLFDSGVYLVVVGGVGLILLTLSDREGGGR